VEKNSKLGKKLLITGGGRCNITNAELNIRKMVEKYGRKGRALFGSFSRFGVAETLEFFHTHKLMTKVEAEKRAFPVSNKAEDVWKTLVEYMKKGQVEVILNNAFTGLKTENGRIVSAKFKKGEIAANNFIIATGGKSRPETGSTGEGLEFLKAVGHSVEESDAALVPVKIHEQWAKDWSGLSFPAARLTTFQDGKKQESRIGKLLFTHFGLSGPLVLNMSKNISELYKYAPVNLEVDLYPDLDIPALDKKLLAGLQESLNKQVKNTLGVVVPPRMIAALLSLAKINPEIEVNALTKPDRLKIVKLIKALPLTVSGFLGVEKAIVTSGGVSLKEIDFKAMRSKLYPNLFLAGDVLNFDRPSGGFSLQICWTTGYLAGENSINK
jgi:predicted Rossmann fold flavoprotein